MDPKLMYYFSSVGTETALWLLKCAELQTVATLVPTELGFEPKHIWFSYRVALLLHWNLKFSSAGYLYEVPFLFNNIPPPSLCQKTRIFLLFSNGKTFMCCSIGTVYLFWAFGRILMFSGSEGWGGVVLTLSIGLNTFMGMFTASISVILL